MSESVAKSCSLNYNCAVRLIHLAGLAKAEKSFITLHTNFSRGGSTRSGILPF